MDEFRDVAALEAALADLGALLAERDLHFEICIIGGAAFLMQEPFRNFATADVDVAARLENGVLTAEDVVPEELARAVRDVSLVHGLGPGWVNGAVANSFGMLLPDGFIARAARRDMGGLTAYVASRDDLLHLKMLAALQRRGAAGARHLEDIKRAEPTRDEISRAVARIRRELQDPNVFHERLDRIEREFNA